jgi:hypothetical protein
VPRDRPLLGEITAVRVAALPLRRSQPVHQQQRCVLTGQTSCDALPGEGELVDPARLCALTQRAHGRLLFGQAAAGPSTERLIVRFRLPPRAAPAQEASQVREDRTVRVHIFCTLCDLHRHVLCALQQEPGAGRHQRTRRRTQRYTQQADSDDSGDHGSGSHYEGDDNRSARKRTRRTRFTEVCESA